ncbi:hypothetical protein SAMN04488066_10475 [Halorubrum aquaticum]|uniref:Uncharacterized protein n=1 Tax=Halorubrum aquaticum TaxID=387340 RepID=A0A1I3A2B3_9EURY|nr:hypothetical protein [Halorubrum aquaticum]SFH44247.1 hypothetical protein SAMN04488066_10475 [Halorubrum aquaticum]
MIDPDVDRRWVTARIGGRDGTGLPSVRMAVRFGDPERSLAFPRVPATTTGPEPSSVSPGRLPSQGW